MEIEQILTHNNNNNNNNIDNKWKNMIYNNNNNNNIWEYMIDTDINEQYFLWNNINDIWEQYVNDVWEQYDNIDINKTEIDDEQFHYEILKILGINFDIDFEWNDWISKMQHNLINSVIPFLKNKNMTKNDFETYSHCTIIPLFIFDNMELCIIIWNQNINFFIRRKTDIQHEQKYDININKNKIGGWKFEQLYLQFKIKIENFYQDNLFIFDNFTNDFNNDASIIIYDNYQNLLWLMSTFNQNIRTNFNIIWYNNIVKFLD